jgi:predicted GIY-YIG superfamily endonuclease
VTPFSEDEWPGLHARSLSFVLRAAEARGIVMAEHRDGSVKGFTARYGLKTLVYFEQYDDLREAIRREKNMKHWPRTWKVRLILGKNPEWNDLYETLT